ncbi:hypothetical protein Tco_1080083 [Tanacetum coccineum]|uniref:Uncharacterized protein n=1 Tax=Tanacetum coccineum TaxID=301880 RepID=A0ABQ5HVM9_9ASTR
MVVQHQEEIGEGSSNPTDPHHTPIIIQPSISQLQKKQRSRRSKRKDIEVPQPSGPTTNVVDEAVNEEMEDSGGPRRQETMGDIVAQTMYKNVSKLSNDPLLAREKKGVSRTYELKRLYKISLSRRVESSNEEGLGEEDASKQGKIADIDVDAGINIVSTHFDADTNMFGVHDLVGDEVVVESEVVVKAASTIPVSAATTTTTVITNDEITLAKVLTELKSAQLPTTTAATIIIVMSTRPRAKRLVIHEQEQAPTPTVSSQPPSQLNVQDKAEEEEEERLAREKAQQIKEVNIDWEDVYARVEVDYQLAQRLQAQEQEELTDE